MAPGPRERMALALGNDGSAILIAPQSNVAAVTLGRTVAGSAACPLSAEDVAASALGVGSARRDDAARGEETSRELAARADDALETREEWTSRRAATKKVKAKVVVEDSE